MIELLFPLVETIERQCAKISVIGSNRLLSLVKSEIEPRAYLTTLSFMTKQLVHLYFFPEANGELTRTR